MTLTLELPAEVESALQAAAAREGVAFQALVLNALRERAQRQSPESIEEARIAHRARVREGFGKFAHVPGTVDGFMRERSEEAARETLQAAGIEEHGDSDGALWRDVAALIADRRRGGQRLALGDAWGVALARRENADFVTADRGELEAVAQAGACRIIFIR